MTLGRAGAAYLALGFVLWVHAWTEGASTHTAVRLRRPGALPVVLPVAGHGAGPRAEPVLLDGALPPDGHQPAGPDVGHRAEPPARARDVDLGPGRLAQRRLHHDARPDRLHRVRRDPALGLVDAGRLRRWPALRLLALRPDEPRVRPPDDRGPHAAAAHPGRPRRDPDPPAPQPALGRAFCSPSSCSGSSSCPPSCWPSRRS